MSQDHSPHALAPGTKIRDYTILSVIGTGGFSIVYKAMDNALMREVAIKEYFPSSFATRAPDGTVHPHSREADTFNTGIVSFLNEGKLLASFDHPALVRVYRCWEESGTAYLAMKLYTGDTLRQAVENERFVVTEASIKTLLLPICETLELLHNAKCYHRDVAPDNILLADTHMPVLLDFGAARRAIEGTQVFTAILKPGYAPIEQYGDGELKQGAWTDIYALAGVVHFALAGKAPPTAISRILKDAMPNWLESFAGRLPDQWLAGFQKALAVKPENRPQTIAEFLDLLGWDLKEFSFEPVTTIATQIAQTTQVAPTVRTAPAAPNPLAAPSTDEPPRVATQPQARAQTQPPVTGGITAATAAEAIADRPVSQPMTRAETTARLAELRAEMAALEAIDEEKTVVMPRPTAATPPRTQPRTELPPAEDPSAAIAAMAAAAAAAATSPEPAFARTPVSAPAPAPAARVTAPAPARPIPPPAREREPASASRLSPALIIGAVSAVLVVGALGWQFMGRSKPAEVVNKAPDVPAQQLAQPPAKKEDGESKDGKDAKPVNDVVSDIKPSIPKEAEKTPVKDATTASKAADPAPKEADKSSPKTVTPPPAKSAEAATGKRESKSAPKQDVARQDSEPRGGPAGSQEAEEEFDRQVFGKSTKKASSSAPSRCTSLNEAFGLGNALTDEEQRFLRERCSR